MALFQKQSQIWFWCFIIFKTIWPLFWLCYFYNQIITLYVRYAVTTIDMDSL